MEKLEVIIGSQDAITIEKLSSVLGSFDKIGKISIVSSLSDLRPHLERKVQGYFFVIDLCSKNFNSLKQNISKIIEDKNQQVLFLSHSKEESESLENHRNILSSDFGLIELATKLADLLNSQSISYFPINLKNFYKVEKYPCDIFIRIGMSKFIKIASENELMEIDVIEKYIKKNINKLYVADDDFFKKCQKLFTAEVASKNAFESKEDYLRKSHQILHEMALELGITEFVKNQVEDSITELESDLNSMKLGNILKLFQDSKGTFIYDHSFLTLTFSRLLCKHMDWQSEEILKKLSLACMLHDLAHQNAQKAQFETLNMAKLQAIDKEDQKGIFDHSEKMAKMLEENHDMPQEVVNLVRNHHEGLGKNLSYPKGLTGVQLNQLDCVFIVAHSFVIEIYKVAFSPNKLSLCYDEIVSNYTSGHFKTVLKAFEKLAKEDLKIKS